MGEFKIGDRVRMTSLIARGSLGRIVEITESVENPYHIALLDENGNDEDDPIILHQMAEDEFEPENAIYENVDIMDTEVGDYISENTDGSRPQYRIGDIVTSSDDPEDILYVISESTLIDTGEYIYELTSAHGGGIPPIQSKESAINFHFHDRHWENKLRANEAFLEMATIVRNENKGFLISVNPERERLSIPYFKVYDSSSFNTSKRVIRLHFKDSGMEYHKDSSGKKVWDINDKYIGYIVEILSKQSKRDKKYTYWNVMCFQWNYENALIDDDLDAYMRGEYDDKYKDIENTRLQKAYVPSDQKMPKEWLYDKSKGNKLN